MSGLGYILLALTVIWTVARFRRDVHSGMCTFLALLVFLPALLRIPMPPGVPQAGVHRMLLVIALIYLVKTGYFSQRSRPVPFLKWILLFGLSQVVSLLLGISFGPGLNAVVDYAMEVAVFFVLVTVYIQREPGIVVRLLSAVCYGLGAVAVLAVIQKYFDFAAVAAAVPDSQADTMAGDIFSTYPHRILFGYAMAMGVPLALVLSGRLAEKAQRLRMRALVILLIAADYFSMSRGSWMGLALGLVGLGLAGGKSVRKKLAVIAVLTLAVLILRPGVRATIQNLSAETFETDTLKADSYQVRWQLWDVAWTEIRKSPGRFLFGYGPLSTETLDFTSYFEGEGASAGMILIGHTSWDNNYAAVLIECGAVGFVLQAILFVAIAAALFRNWRRSDPETRDLRAALALSCLIFMFAMTNVFIFSPQLKYLFLALAAIGTDFSWTLAPAMADRIEVLPQDLPEFAGAAKSSSA